MGIKMATRSDTAQKKSILRDRKTDDVETIKAWVLLEQVYHSTRTFTEKEIESIGISLPQLYILLGVKYLESPVYPTTIARWLDRKNNNITITIGRMVKSGLIKRMRDSRDRRMLKLTLTPKSEELVGKARKILVETPKVIMSCLSDEELELFIKIMKKLRQNTYEKRNIKDEVVELINYRSELLPHLLKSSIHTT
jgi:MarR family transcriptional regulator, 2-MHQ and catechol-resistance regulon repressor